MHSRLTASLVATAAVVVAAVLGCGAGGGTSTFLPPGEPTTAPPGDFVIYATLSNDDRIVGYRLGADGLMPREPFTSIELDNPRAMVLGDGILYVVLEDRAVALTLAADGTLPTLPSSQTQPIESDPEAVDLLLLDEVLYVAFQEINSIRAFVLESGQLPPTPISISGTSQTDYRTIAAGNGFLYAASLGDAEIDTYIIQPDGSLPATPEPQDPETEIFRPEDMLVNVEDNVLYAISQSRERIEAFNIRPNGLLPDEFDTRTSAEQRYARLLLDGDRLYASGIGKGKIDLFLVNPDGSLPEGEPFASTARDTAAFPIGIVLNDGILYVAQSGLGRIDAYILGGDGTPPEFPSSSTDPIDGTFPLELAIGSFPE